MAELADLGEAFGDKVVEFFGPLGGLGEARGRARRDHEYRPHRVDVGIGRVAFCQFYRCMIV